MDKPEPHRRPWKPYAAGVGVLCLVRLGFEIARQWETIASAPMALFLNEALYSMVVLGVLIFIAGANLSRPSLTAYRGLFMGLALLLFHDVAGVMLRVWRTGMEALPIVDVELPPPVEYAVIEIGEISIGVAPFFHFYFFSFSAATIFWIVLFLVTALWVYRRDRMDRAAASAEVS